MLQVDLVKKKFQSDVVIGSLDFLKVLQPFVIDVSCFKGRWSMSYSEDLKSGENLVVI